MIHAIIQLINIIIILQSAQTKLAQNISFEPVFEVPSFQYSSNTTEKGSPLNPQAIPSTIRFNFKGELFMSIPRNATNYKDIPATLHKLDSNGVLTPWPDLITNDYNQGLLQSVVGFEIDLGNNLWVLNHKETHCELIKFTTTGEHKIYSLKDTTNSSSYLDMISLDNKKNFAFIVDSQSRDITNSTNLENYGLILVNLKLDVSWKIFGRTLDVNPELNKAYYPVYLNTVSLRCDKRYLFYSSFMSDKLKIIRTSPLRNNQSIEEGTLLDLTKNEISKEILSSARGHFYFTSEGDREVHEQFYEKDFAFNNIQHLGWFNNDEQKNKMNKEFFPISIAFNGTTGYLYVLMSRFNRNLKENVITVKGDNAINYGLYKAYVNDRSYLYECNFEQDIGVGGWILVVTISIMLSSTVLYFINFLTSTSNQTKLTQKEKGYEESGTLLVEDFKRDKSD